MRTLQDLDVAGKRVLVRVDFNVPQAADGSVTDDTRIRAALPTLEALRTRGACVVLMSHLGRPKGQINPKYTLRPVAGRLSELIGAPVAFAEDCIGPGAEAAAAALHPGELLLLENTRFHAEEEKNDGDFARALARLGDCYVNDAFGTAHRANASTEAVAHLLPSAAGLLLEREIAKLGPLLHNPEKPFVAILGGAKVTDKIGVIEKLLPLVDRFLVGGAMVFPFLKARGISVGRSLCKDEDLAAAKALLARPEVAAKLQLATDFIVTNNLEAPTLFEAVPADGIPDHLLGADVGPDTLMCFHDLLLGAKTVIWNGPMGRFEDPHFATGTRGLAEILARVNDAGAVVIVGGGDSAAAVQQFGYAGRMDHISTGGGASLEFLEGRTLPGVAALS